MDGKEPEMKPLETISRDETDFEKNKKKFICELCKKEFMGSKSYEGHINGKRHRAEVRKIAGLEPPVSIKLCSYDPEKRKESARMLKSSFARPMSFILEKMDNLPAHLPKIKSKSQAENIVKCLAKHGIVIEIIQASSEASTT